MCPLPLGRAAGGLVCPPPRRTARPRLWLLCASPAASLGPGLVHNSGALTRPQQMGIDEAQPAGSDVATLDT